MSRRRQGLQNVGQITAKNDELDQNPAYSSAIVNDLTGHLYTDVMGIAFVTNKAYNCHNVERDKDSCITNDEERMRSGSDNVYESQPAQLMTSSHILLDSTIYLESQYLKANFQTSTIFAATFRAVQPLV